MTGILTWYCLSQTVTTSILNSLDTDAFRNKYSNASRIRDIRLRAVAGAQGLKDRIIYWMQVDEVVTFDQYWSDERFEVKRSVMSGSRMQIYGDNIYRRCADGTFVQADSFHSEPGGVTSLPNLVRDTGRTDRVLLGREYAYWGGSGPRVPQELRDLVRSTQGHRNQVAPDRVDAFVAWLRGMPGRGFLGRPANWPA